MPWDEPTRARVLASMTSIYDLFLKRISEGRGVPVEKVATYAEGRIFGGVEAKERGLVDALGGVGDAIDLARELASLPKDAPLEVVDEDSGLLGLLEESERSGGDDEQAPSALARAGSRATRELAFPPGWASSLPGAEAFLGSVSPLLAGEGTLASMPYGLIVR